MNQNERHTLNGGESTVFTLCLVPRTFAGCAILDDAADYRTFYESRLDETLPVASPRYATEAEIDRALDALTSR